MKKQWNSPTLEVLDVKNTFSDAEAQSFFRCPPGYSRNKWGQCVKDKS